MMRPYTDNDRDSVLDVWYRASSKAHSFLPDDFFDAERHQIAEEWLPSAETTVYELEGSVVGFLSLVGNEVGGLFVDPDHQGRGIGRALMDDARDSRPFLELDVFEANSAARGFYEEYGFELVDKHVSEATGHSELRLRLDRPAKEPNAAPTDRPSRA